MTSVKTALEMAIECMKWLRLRPDLSILPETEAEKMCKAALEQPAEHTMTYQQGFEHGYEAHKVEHKLEQPARNCAFEDDAMYYAWRKWEAYQVPATEEGTRMMRERAQAFIAGWLASKGEKDE